MTVRPWIIYARVSTEDQAQGGISLDAQLESCRAWAALKQVPIAEEIVDAGQSAKTLHRPGMERLLQMVGDGTVAGVIAWRLDRLTRSIRDLLTLLEVFGEDHGLVSATEQLDTTTPMGRFVVHLLGAVAQWERETIAARTSSAMQHARRQGYWVGGRVPPGCRKVRDGQRWRLEPNDDADVVRQIWPMALGGHSMREIAQAMEQAGIPGRWTTARVNNMIKSRSLTGVLVDEPTQQQVIDLLANKENPMRRGSDHEPKPPRKAKRDSPIRDLVRCPTCGAAMVQVTAHGRGGVAYPYFRCCRRPKRLCDQKDLRAEPLEAQVLEAVTEALSGGAYEQALLAEIAPLQGAGAEIRSQMATLTAEAEQLAAKLGDLAMHGPRPGSAAFRDLCAPLADRRDQIETEMHRLEGRLAAVAIDEQGAEYALANVRRGIAALADADLATQRHVLAALVHRVRPGADQTELEMYLPHNALSPTDNAISPAQAGGAEPGSSKNRLRLPDRCQIRTISVVVQVGRVFIRA